MKKSNKPKFIFLSYETPINIRVKYKIENTLVELEDLEINSNGYLTSELNSMLDKAKKTVQKLIANDN